ncbi:MAG: hypothetical protein AB1762_21465, partial [Gemmatimonadota bacterium]
SWDAVVTEDSPATLIRQQSVQASILVALLVLGHPTIYRRVSEPRVVKAVASLRSPTLNAHDAAVEHRGYYEKLDRAGRLDAQLWRASSTMRPADWVALEASPLYEKRSDFLGGELRPSMQHRLNGKLITTNRWRMRDREYALAKPHDTYRIAVLGPSFVMGSSVSDDETFESILEKRLNAESVNGTSYEVLNFGVGNYSLLQQVTMLTDRVWEFEPDAVVVTMTHRRFLVDRIVSHLSRAVTSNIAIPDPDIRDLVQNANVTEVQPTGVVLAGKQLLWAVARKLGATREMLESSTERHIRSLADRIVTLALQRVAREAQEHRVIPILMGLDNVSAAITKELPGQRAAEDAGFVVLNLFDVYDGETPSNVRAAEWDSHPNPYGHRLIAHRLFAELARRASTLRLNLSSNQHVAQATR